MINEFKHLLCEEMKKNILYIVMASVFLMLAILCQDAIAQDFASRVKSDRQIACGVYHPYHHGDLADTPAPKGYKPFYISHFGRHGSRYHTTVRYFAAALKALEKADSADALTTKGRHLLEDMTIVNAVHQGMEGQLSPLGGREHQAIARRMYQRFTPVFSSKERNEVRCASSTVDRCIVSMANFSQSLASCSPDLDFQFFTGDKYYAYIANKGPLHKEVSNYASHFTDSLRRSICTFDKLLASVFVSKEAADTLVKNPIDFVRSVYMAGSICPDLNYMDIFPIENPSGRHIDLFEYLDDEELLPQIQANSSWMYCHYGNSAECGEKIVLNACKLLSIILEEASAAVKKGSMRAADLRFGHDTGILPLLGLIGVEGMTERRPSDKSWEFWTTYDRIPMATNLQMIFYRNKKDEVLVKMLYNEQEVTIPALVPASGPYYEWNELYRYLNQKSLINNQL